MLFNGNLLSLIEEKIDEIENEYRESQGLILTEDDLRCILYKKLIDIPLLSEHCMTRDYHIKASKVHSEVSWFNDKGRLAIRPDITILEPENLSILTALQPNFPLPRKGFHSIGDSIIFEIKFIRQKSGINKRVFEKEIKKDFKKIKKLFHKLDNDGSSNKFFCFFIVFSKVNKSCKEFKEFLINNQQQSRYQIIYKTGNVVFKKIKLYT